MTKTISKKQFDAMTLSARRVLIAKYVLARLDAKQFHVDGQFRHGESARVVLKEQKCQVCGAIFVAGVCRIGKLAVDDMINVHQNAIHAELWQIRNYLRGLFSVKQLNLIEFAFEGLEVLEVLDFNLRHAETNEVRLRVIMENIIYNRGTFNPKREPPKGSSARSILSIEVCKLPPTE